MRFAVNPPDSPGQRAPLTNGYGGYPSLIGLGTFLALQITLSGELDEASSYLVNIRQIDALVRQRATPRITRAYHAPGPGRPTPERLLEQCAADLRDAWPGLRLEEVRLVMSPFLSYSLVTREHPMVRLSQKFEFSATHRLHNPALDEARNRDTYGKCNNPHGHGHNYEVQVTLAGQPNASGVLIDVPQFEALVADTVIDRFDHKNLNVEVPEFRTIIPTVENIAKVIHGLLLPRFNEIGVKLASVTVWETPKTWAEVS